MVDFSAIIWAAFGVAVVSAVALTLRMRQDYKESGWWTGLAAEGRTIHVGVDHALCMGSASCVELAPKVFHLDWSKKKSIFDPAPLESFNDTGTASEVVFKAAQSCPYRAIFLQDAATRERIFP